MSRPWRPKSRWYTRSRRAQERWKAETDLIPNDARGPGTCWVDKAGKREEIGPFPICLPTEVAAFNLLPSVRDQAFRLFTQHDIQWHMGTPGQGGVRMPSTHLLDSQVQCVNVLLALAAAGALLDLVREVVPDAVRLVDIEVGGPVAFEWNGLVDHLGETPPGAQRRRGTMSTNADALLVALREDGGRTAVLVEWKFTETYPSPVPFFRHNGTDRRVTYGPLYENAAQRFGRNPDLSAFFQEPHYQLLRQALLGIGMVETGELGIDRAVLLHLVPGGNRTLRRTVPDGLADLGDEIDVVWHRLLPGPTVRYACMDTAPLFRNTPELAERYGMLAG